MKMDLDISWDFKESDRHELGQLAEGALQKCSAQFEGIVEPGVSVKVIFSSGKYGGEALADGIHISLTAGQWDGAELGKMIHHEMVHFCQTEIIGEDNRYRLPQWFSEGMAVAMAGQRIVYSGDDVAVGISEFREIGIGEYLFMNEYIHFDWNKRPFDMLYALWGSMFIYVVSSGERISQGYKKDDGPYLLNDEIKRAISMIEKYRAFGFKGDIQIREDREKLTPDNVDRLLAEFLQYPA